MDKRLYQEVVPETQEKIKSLFIKLINPIADEDEKKALVKDMLTTHNNDSSNTTFTLLQEAILSDNLPMKKLSLHILHIIAKANNELDSDYEKSPWVLFFDTFDTLDETQFHVIEPFITKIEERKEEFFNSTMFCWYLVLLHKMMCHDNRFIVKKGLNAFLTSNEWFSMQNENLNDSTLTLYHKILHSTVKFTIFNDIGWICPEMDEFYKLANEFGKFLSVYRNPKSLEHVLNLLCNWFSTLFGTEEKKLNSLGIVFLLQSLIASLVRYGMDHQMKKTCHHYTRGALLNIVIANISSVIPYFRSVIDFQLITIFKHFAKSDFPVDYALEFIDSLSRSSICSYWNSLMPSISISKEVSAYLKPSGYKSCCAGRVFFLDMCHHTSDQDNLNQWTRANLHKFIKNAEFFKCVNYCSQKKVLFLKSLQSVQGWEYAYLKDDKETKMTPLESTELLMILVKNNFHSLAKSSELCCGVKCFQLFYTKQLEQAKVKSDIQNLKCLHVTLFQNLQTLMKKPEPTGCNIPQDHRLVAESYEVRLNVLLAMLKLGGTQDFNLKQVNTEKRSVLSFVNPLDTLTPSAIVASMNFVTAGLSSSHFNHEIESMPDFIHCCWSHVLELRKTDVFWESLKAFIGLITHERLEDTRLLSEYAMEILRMGETIIGMPLLLMESLNDLQLTTMKRSRCLEVVQIAQVACSLGPHLLKHNSAMFRMYDYECRKQDTPKHTIVASKSWERPEFPIIADRSTRLLGILKLVAIDKNDIELLSNVVNFLLNQNDNESKRHKRYFSNSPTHRKKHRIAQTLLFLQPFFTEEIAELANGRLLDSLALDIAQLSVRFLLEWIIIKNLVKFPGLHSQFFEVCKEHIKQRPGFGCIFSTITLHVSRSLPFNTFSESGMSILVSLIISAHIQARTHAVICYQKIYDHWIDSKMDGIDISKYSLVYTSIVEGSILSSGIIQKAMKIVKDFWIDFFLPMDDYDFETILMYLPEISGMSFDENIHRKDLFHILKTYLPDGLNYLPVSSTHRSMAYEEFLKQMSLTASTTVDDFREMGEEAYDENSSPIDNERKGGSTMQKKINPWRFLPVLDQELDDFSESVQQRKRKSSEDGVIVVASLIDRIPNLGGLCRSCEVFGVSKYVISSMKILNDQQFKNLSVSSQNWVEILEVFPRDLEVFLKTYAEKGYCILGIEQAVGSIPLHKFKFPKKSILLLGHEKYGIPANLLHLMDNCLEIPQTGIVRSLNVHVTGALCIWQYAKDHLLNCQ